MKSVLLTRVRKDGVLGKDERIKTLMQTFGSDPGTATIQATRASNQSATGRIEARIRSSKKVAEVMRNCVKTLRDLVLGKDGNNSVFKNTHDEEYTPELEVEDTITGEAGTGAGADDERSPSDGFSDAGWESGSIDNVDLGNVDEDEGGDDSEWKSGSVSSKGHPNKKKMKLKTGKDLPRKPPVQPALITTNTQSLAQSTFLPSLATGYIRGDSSADDQWSDIEDPFPQERKNRRGQRARRA
jgi:BUD22